MLKSLGSDGAASRQREACARNLAQLVSLLATAQPAGLKSPPHKVRSMVAPWVWSGRMDPEPNGCRDASGRGGTQIMCAYAHFRSYQLNSAFSILPSQ